MTQWLSPKRSPRLPRLPEGRRHHPPTLASEQLAGLSTYCARLKRAVPFRQPGRHLPCKSKRMAPDVSYPRETRDRAVHRLVLRA